MAGSDISERELHPLDIVPLWMARALHAAVAAGAIILLCLHSFNVVDVHVDGVSIGLLAVLGLVPMVGQVRRLKYKELEAEFVERTARRLEVTTADLPAPPKAPGETDEPLSPEELARRDPVLALAQLRIEVERELRRVAPVSKGEKRVGGILELVRRAEHLGAIDPIVGLAVRDVALFTNQAVHGQDVPRDVAMTVLHVGAKVLFALREGEPPSQPENASLSRPQP